MSQRLMKEKYDTINRLLGDEYVLLHLDSTQKGVKLPEHIMNTPQVTLKVSRLFRGGLTLNDDSIESHLLFGNDYHQCVVPFMAIWGATSTRGHNIIWPESAPKHILAQITQTTIQAAESEDSAPKKSPVKKKAGGVAKRKVSHLRRVK